MTTSRSEAGSVGDFPMLMVSRTSVLTQTRLLEGREILTEHSVLANLSLSGHKAQENARKTAVARRKEVFYTIEQLSAEPDLPILGKPLRSDSFKPCVAIGGRTKIGRRADNTILCERRRQTCPTRLRLFWPLAFSPSPLPALSRKRSSWSSRSWKKLPCPSSDLSEPSGARQRTRQFMASASGGWPC